MVNSNNGDDASKPNTPLPFVPIKMNCIEDVLWEHIVKYNDVLYHLMVEENRHISDCVENQLLREMKEAQLGEEDGGIDNVSFKIVEQFQPFLLANSYRRVAGKPEQINLQLRTVNGRVQCTTHSSETIDVDKSTFYIEDTFSNVKKISADKVTLLEEISAHIYKVNLEGSSDVYVLKCALRGRPVECIRKEIETLMCMKKHKNIVSLVGLTHEEDGRISGIVLPFIEGKLLDEIEQATKVEKENWINSIKEAVKQIHGCGRVWEDAKAGHVFIANGEVVMIDFEGGFTEGWVDKENTDSQQGDWQGIDSIVRFIEKIEEVGSFLLH